MDIKQIRSDYENGVVIGRETWKELIAFCEQADAIIAGRQQAIGALNMRIAELEQRGVNVPQVRSNPAAHDWAAPSGMIDSQELLDMMTAWADISPGTEAHTLYDKIIAHIDARLAAVGMVDKRDAERLEFFATHCLRDGSMRLDDGTFKAVKAWSIASHDTDIRAAIDAMSAAEGEKP